MPLSTRPRRPCTASGALQIAAATIGAAALLGDPGAANTRDDARAFLNSAFAITDGELSRVREGQVVARSLPADDGREVATLGVVRMQITPEFYVNRLNDIATFKKDEAVLQVGVFGDPPSVRDIAALTLDEVDIKSLRECRVGDCGVQLPAQAIERFRREIDWRRTDAADQAHWLMRRIIADYAAKYRQNGAAAGMTYADRKTPLSLSHEFTLLAGSSVGGWQHFSPLLRHMTDYPTVRAADVDDLLYWSREQVGRRTVASVTHLAISRCGDGVPADYAIASKQIYGTHYYDASLGLTVLVPDRASTAPATYVVYLNRSRVDVFRGMFGGIARRIVTSKARTTVADQLGRLKARLERTDQ
jgi:hypothetical protein